MALKPMPIVYQSRINALGAPATGLANVKGQVYVDGVAKAVGANAITFSELDQTNAPGIYLAVLTAAMLTSYGATVGSTVEVQINSVTQPAPAIFKQGVTAISTDDLDAHLTTQDTAIANVKADTAAIRLDLESGPAALTVLNTKLDKILNNSGFALAVPEQMLRPQSGTNSYRISQTFYDEDNEALLDVDGNAITVTLTNQAGADRSQYLTGYVAGSNGALGSAPAVRDSIGQYHVDVNIPSTAAQEQLSFSFGYGVRNVATVRKATSVIITDVQAQGFALQSTVLDVQTRVTDVQSKVNDQTVGLAAANTLQVGIKTQTDRLADPNVGLTALKAQAVANGSTLADIEGQGFDTTQDSLHQLGLFLRTNLLSGGRAV